MINKFKNDNLFQGIFEVGTASQITNGREGDTIEANGATYYDS